jgi:polysaccharide biosynthesis protein PslH
MKIGIIAPYDVLKQYNGASVRVYELAKNLNAKGASVFVLNHGLTQSFGSDLKFVSFKAFSIFHGSNNYLHPLNLMYPYALFRFLRKFKPDIIQCEQPWSMFPTLLFAKNYGLPCVLDEHNVEFLWVKNASKVRFLAAINLALEKIAVKFSSLIITTSKIDKELLFQIYGIPHKKILVVPNGVNLHRFSFTLSAQSQLKKKLELSSEKKIVLFHGVMDARQNYEAARLIIDFIAPKITDATFLIIGANAPRWLESKAKLQKNVSLIGYASNIEEYIAVADVCIAPIQSGSGTRLKVLEYLAAGKPIVATTKAVEGISIDKGVHSSILREVNEDFVDAIKQLLTDNSTNKTNSENARQLAMRYDWKKVTAPLFHSYDLIIESKRCSN